MIKTGAEKVFSTKSAGVEHLHFYTLNRPELVRDVCHALGLVPEPRLCQVA